MELSKNFDISVAEFIEENTDALVVYPKMEIQKLEIDDRIINMHDTHPSEKVNKIIADKILPTLIWNE